MIFTLVILPDDDPDKILIKNLYQQEHDRWVKLARKYLGNMTGYMPEDIVQDVFLRLLFHTSDLQKRSENARAAYISMALLNRCNELRRKKESVILTDDLNQIPQEKSDPSEIYEIMHRRKCFYEIFEKLSKENKELVLSHYILGLSYDEISAIYHIPSGTVRSKISRSRKQCRLMAKEVLKDEQQE